MVRLAKVRLPRDAAEGRASPGGHRPAGDERPSPESGEAQSATAAWDQALDALDAWVTGFRAICKVALAEDPQQLEQLGIVVLNQARRKAKVVA